MISPILPLTFESLQHNITFRFPQLRKLGEKQQKAGHIVLLQSGTKHCTLISFHLYISAALYILAGPCLLDT